MFRSQVDAFCNMQNSEATKREYRKDLERWFNSGLPLTVDGVTQYKVYLEANFAEASAGRFWSTVRSFHKWLVRCGLLDYSPFENVKAPKRMTGHMVQSPSDNNVDALVASCTKPRDLAVIQLLLCGLRASEVVNLRADSVKFEPEYGHYLVVIGKGNKERIVPISQTVIDAVNACGNDGSDWLVVNTDGKKLTYDTVNGIVDSVSRKAGVRIYPHLLRHHYGTRMARAGVNIITLGKLLGHADVKTTAMYVTTDLTDLVEASRLDPRNNGGIRLVTSNLEGEVATSDEADHRGSLSLASS